VENKLFNEDLDSFVPDCIFLLSNFRYPYLPQAGSETSLLLERSVLLDLDFQNARLNGTGRQFFIDTVVRVVHITAWTSLPVIFLLNLAFEQILKHKTI